MVRGICMMLMGAMFALSGITANAQTEVDPREQTGRLEGGRGDPGEFDDEDDAPRRQESMLMWLARSLGMPYVFLLPLLAIFSYILTLALLVFGKGNST